MALAPADEGGEGGGMIPYGRRYGPRKAPEHDFQAHTLKPYLDLALVRDAFWTSIDHAGGGMLLGALRKAKGAKSGLPDVWIVWQQRLYCMELKAAKGTVADNQIACTRGLANAGAPTWTVRTLEDAEAALLSWGMPLRSRLPSRSAVPATGWPLL